jgi:hypothetical protein
MTKGYFTVSKASKHPFPYIFEEYENRVLALYGSFENHHTVIGAG